MVDPTPQTESGLTAEQEAAASATQPRVFVAAGAGTGKTKLLVERYVRALVDDGLSVDELPTVTFTRKAAAEMRRRIRVRLIEQGRMQLAWTLDAAPISTVHGVCGTLLRRDPLAAGVDPGFAVADEEQSSILLEEAFEEAWEAVLEGSSDDEFELAARYWGRLEGSVPGLYSGLRGLGMDAPRCAFPVPRDAAGARDRLAAALQSTIDFVSPLEVTGTALANLERAVACARWLPGAGPTWQDVEQSHSFIPKLNCTKVTKPYFENIKVLLLEFHAVLGEQYLQPLGTFLDKLLLELGMRYRARNRAQGLLDFNDLEIHARSLATSAHQPFGPRARLMVDEFQDTNEVQCAILEALDAASFFSVGDSRQSIYAFRGADVGVFRRQEADARAATEGEAFFSHLSLNFRSRAALLAVINHVFGHPGLFGSEFSRLCPYRVDDVQTAPEETLSGGLLAPSMEVMVLPKGDEWEGSLSAVQAEARVVAARIAALVSQMGWRPRDVAVLTRTLTHVREYEQALEARGVPSYVVQGRGYYDREELSDVLSLLRVLLNPCDDQALVAMLRSPMCGVCDDLLYLLRLQAQASGATYLWEVVGTEMTGARPEEIARLRDVRESVSCLRHEMGAPGLARSIEGAIEAFGYDLVLLAAPDGARRFANVLKLMRIADEFESLEGPRLAGFLRYVENRRDLRASREGNAALMAEEDDVVRIMTIHQAKGLEFPVVVVAGTGGRPKATEAALKHDRTGAVAATLPGPGDSRLSAGPAERIGEERLRVEREEEARLYYVAMTRAKERLIVVGSVGYGGSTPADSHLSSVLASLDSPASDLERGVAVRPRAELDVIVSRPLDPGGGAVSPQSHRDTATSAPAPPAPLPPVRPRARMRKISFSALSQYTRCPRGYYLERVLGLRPPDTRSVLGADALYDGPLSPGDDPVEASGPDGRLLGHVVHGALERLCQQPEPDARRLGEVVRSVAARVAADGRERPASDPGTLEHKALDLVRAFWRSPVSRAAGLSAARTEVPFLFPWKAMSALPEETLVAGVVDLLVEGPDEWGVVDYKSNRLDGRRPEDLVAAHYADQARLYALGCLLAGAPAVSVSFLFLERPEKPVTMTYGPDDVQGLEAWLDGALQGLVAGDFSRREKSCSDCALGDVCLV